MDLECPGSATSTTNSADNLAPFVRRTAPGATHCPAVIQVRIMNAINQHYQMIFNLLIIPRGVTGQGLFAYPSRRDCVLLVPVCILPMLQAARSRSFSCRASFSFWKSH